MTNYIYLYEYDNNGYPKSNDVLTSTVITNELNVEISNIFEESVKILDKHPDWAKKSNIETIDNCEVEVVFIKEGAGYRNGLGYYVYDLLNEPKSFSEIDEIKIIFPNASLNGSGGKMNEGDTLKIPYEVLETQKINGKDYATSVNYIFPKDKGVGFVCFSNGWKGSYLRTNTSMLSSNPELNPETTMLKRNHFINYNSISDNSKIIYGVEDIVRDKSYCDHDFNDMIYTLNISPITSVNPKSFNSLELQNFKGTILCEDLLNNPNQDYDYNDLILNYEVVENLDKNTSKILSIFFKIYLISRGASRDHEFGVIIPHIKNNENVIIINEENKTDDNQITYYNQTNDIKNSGSDRVAIVKSTKNCFKGVDWATNTLDGNANVTPSVCTTRILFLNGGVDRSELNNRYFPYNFYLKVERDVNSYYYLYSDQYYDDISNESKNSLINNKKKIIILENVENFRIPLEKKGLKRAYPKFLHYLRGHKKFLGTWYTDKYSKDKLLKPILTYENYESNNKHMNNENIINENNLYVINLEIENDINYVWNENNMQNILSNNSLNISSLLDWNNIINYDVNKINTLIYFINKYGKTNVLNNNNYSSNDLNYYISLSSLENDENRNVIDFLNIENDKIELLSSNEKFNNIIVNL